MTKSFDDVLGHRKAKAGVSSRGSQGRSRRSPLRTVVKARYRTLSPRGNNPGLGRASAVMRNMDYFTTRPDHEHAHRISRDLITHHGQVNMQAHPEIRQQILDELTGDKSKYIYHLVLSSGDKNMSERETELWARAILQSQGAERYYMAIHAGDRGHTENPHAHVVICSDNKFERGDFFEMRRTGDREQQFQMRLYRDLEEKWKDRFTSSAQASASGRDLEDDEGPISHKREVDIDF